MTSMIGAAGAALLHFLWQGAALAALAAVLMGASRRAAVRYVIGTVTLALMTAAPVVTFVFIDRAIARPLPAIPPIESLPPPPAYAGMVVTAWLAGVVVFGARAGAGLWQLARLRRRPSTPVAEGVAQLVDGVAHGLGIARAVRCVHCAWLDAPAVIGWLRPVIYLPLAAMSGLTPEQLRAVIAHELAHVKRLDALVNGVQIAAETLLFYHPAVWWLGRRIREERENCCDDVAVAVTGDAVGYAHALVSLEESRTHGHGRLLLAATGGSLRARVVRLLGDGALTSKLRTASLSLAILAVSAALAAAALLVRVRVDVGAAWSAKVHASTAMHEAVSEREQVPQLSAPHPASGADPDIEQIVSLRMYGIDAEYIDDIAASGYRDLNADTLISLRTHGVDGEFIRGIGAAGFPHLSIDALVNLRMHGITPEYITELRRRGLVKRL